MRLQSTVVILFTIFSLTGCYAAITGRVIDAETQQPIEGAVVLVEWTKKHGIGDQWTESYKVVEAISDKSGNVNIEGCNSPFLDPPYVTVYKKGYVAWNNDEIFPNYARRTNFKWESGNVFKMEKFLESYGYIEHMLFISGTARLSRASDKKKKFREYYFESESQEVQREQTARDNARRLTQ